MAHSKLSLWFYVCQAVQTSWAGGNLGSGNRLRIRPAAQEPSKPTTFCAENINCLEWRHSNDRDWCSALIPNSSRVSRKILQSLTLGMNQRAEGTPEISGLLDQQWNVHPLHFLQIEWTKRTWRVDFVIRWNRGVTRLSKVLNQLLLVS